MYLGRIVGKSERLCKSGGIERPHFYISWKERFSLSPSQSIHIADAQVNGSRDHLQTKPMHPSLSRKRLRAIASVIPVQYHHIHRPPSANMRVVGRYIHTMAQRVLEYVYQGISLSVRLSLQHRGTGCSHAISLPSVEASRVMYLD